ncbi:MAG: hypothetical protein WC872_02780 [Candidatus Absconditabacterales bacterium]
MADKVEQNKPVKTSKHDFYFEVSLYEEVKAENLEDIFTGEIIGYSNINSRETTYTIEPLSQNSHRIKDDKIEYSSDGFNWYKFEGFLDIQLKCKRKNNDILTFNLLIKKDTIIKVGQYPSLADLQFAEIGKKYNNILPKEDLINLKIAIGLKAHGVGAGSFVYLRRIFENLIFETYNIHKTELTMTETDFIGKRMMEKVEILKKYLPNQLIEMKGVYSILSKGVHELSEQDCLKFFSAIKLSIELILDQKIKMKEEEEKTKSVAKEIASITKLIS